MLTKEELPACPVATTVQLIGSKWKLLILRNLLVRPWRFNELRRGTKENIVSTSKEQKESYLIPGACLCDVSYHPESSRLARCHKIQKDICSIAKAGINLVTHENALSAFASRYFVQHLALKLYALFVPEIW